MSFLLSLRKPRGKRKKRQKKKECRIRKYNL
jgi:hypothetical protein